MEEMVITEGGERRRREQKRGGTKEGLVMKHMLCCAKCEM